MLGPEHIGSLLRDALRNRHLGDADIYLTATTQALTRFANNRIHQNVYHDDAVAHVRVAYQKRQGRAVTNNLSPDGLRSAVLQAREHASLMPEDPDFPGLPSASQSASVHAYDEATASTGPEHRAAVVGMVCRKAADAGLEAAGFYRTGVTELAVFSSRGPRYCYHAGTFAGLLITARSDDSAGWAKGGGWRIDAFEPEALADEAIDKAVRGRNPQSLESGEYPVVLEHYAVDDMLEALSFYGMGAHMVQDGRSWMNDVIDQPAMSPLVSIWDDGLAPSGWPVPFDAEGVPRQRVNIVTDGVVQGPVHNSYTAAKAGVASTGHQRGATGGPTATNLFMRPGDRTTDQLIASVDRGLYITRFYYTRLAHNRGCVMTGMTRDGTFLIENGEITTPVKNLRFTQSYVDALAGCQALSNTAHLNLNEAGVAMHVPAALLENWRFTGQTV
ncbi:MAG: TldD/PmbA family protein [Chloroflexi bacterium]|nr:TldD/PmbA family protein [Chloroflexota bacterium]MYD49005.1 TldD/PmbA family protein [Chloroflexota bacterium]